MTVQMCFGSIYKQFSYLLYIFVSYQISCTFTFFSLYSDVFLTGCPQSVSCLSGCFAWFHCRGGDHHLSIFTMPLLSISPNSKSTCSPVWLVCVLLGLLTIQTHAKVGKNLTTFEEHTTLIGFVCLFILALCVYFKQTLSHCFSWQF